MSINRYTYLMTGVRYKEDELPFDKWDDKYLPYIEGHEGIEITIHYGEGSDFIYVGKVLAESRPYSDELSINFESPSHTHICNLINEAFGLKLEPPDIQNWFFDLYH